LPCRSITIPRFAQPSRYFSIQCHCDAFLSLTVAEHISANPLLRIAKPEPNLALP
jgi:hypothetical protein